MSKQKKQNLIATLLIILLTMIDQITKVTVKLNTDLGESIHIFDWFQVQFIENNGMAWDMELGSKLFLSILCIVVIGFLIWYISNHVKHGARMAYIVVLSMITAGTAGNIFDSLFYGQVFTASTSYYIKEAASITLVSWGEGYAPVLMDKVVDMFYFPLFHGTFPDWFPPWGGGLFTLSSPIFNFTDSCISVGIATVIFVFQKDFNGWAPAKDKKAADEENITDNQQIDNEK